jgi:hypothetical protein
MLILNMRAAHYLAPTIPITYLGLGEVLDFFWKEGRRLPSWIPGAAYLTAGLVVVLGLSVNAARALKPPSLKTDIDYYRGVFETYTRPGSTIVTDLGLALSASEGRRFLTIGPFVWERWRLVLPYKTIVQILSPDYIVLTERKRAYAFNDHPQTRPFKDFVKSEFEPPLVIENPDYGALWIYQRRSIGNRKGPGAKAAASQFRLGGSQGLR